MAKRSTALTASRPMVVAVQAPRRAPGRVRRATRSVGRAAKRGGLALARAAYEEKYAVGSVLGALGVGYLDGGGHLDFLPDIGIGRPGTAAAGLYLAGRFMKSQKLRIAGLGLAAVAAWDYGQKLGLQGLQGKTR